MSDASDPASANRRANWVALRTLRQRANVVGRTDDGKPVYEIRSVRLVLPPGAAHLHRLVRCSKCNREMPGPAMVSPADLDRPTNPLFCERCVRAASKTSPAPRRVEAPAPVVEAEPVDVMDGADDRLGAVESQLDQLSAQLGAPAPVADAERAELSASLAVVRAQMQELARAQAEVNQELLEVRAGLLTPANDLEATVRRLLDEAGAATRALLDAERQQFQAALAKAFNGIRMDIASIEQRLDLGSSRQDVLEEKLGGAAEGAKVEEIQDLARAHSELAQTVAELAGRVDTRPGEVDGLRVELSALGRRVDEQAAAFAAGLAAQRDEVATALAHVGQRIPEALAEPLEELARAREELERRLDGLTEATSAHASRQDALERRIDELVRPIELPTTAGAGPERPFGALMESLEKQLRAADDRLSRTLYDAGRD